MTAHLPGDETSLTASELRNLDSVADVLPHWNAHDVEKVLDFYHPDITWHNVAMEETYQGSMQVRGFLNSLIAAFPDLQFEVSWRIARGDEVAEEWTLSGTHRGDFLGIPATGKPFRLDGMSHLTMVDGLFLRDEFYFDSAGFMRQVGLLPSLNVIRGPIGRTALTLAAHPQSVAAATTAAGASALILRALRRRRTH